MPSTSFGQGRLVRFVKGRRRLLSSVVTGIVLYLLLPQGWRTATRFIISWDVAATLYVTLSLVVILRSTVETCHAHAAFHDEGDRIILLLVVASAAASFVAIFAELHKLALGHGSDLPGIVLTVPTVALSWTFTHLVFTFRYANVYYRPGEDGPGGLSFPGNRAPDYRDFLYYSFVIGCAAQTGDVATVSPAMRRLTMVHGIVAFAFNTAILALMINVGASLL